MISAMPDVRLHWLDAARDRFMVVACDGIWNSLTSQQVVDFVQARLDQHLSATQIAEQVRLTPSSLTPFLNCIIDAQLCDECLAPDTDGDGTGCDNMTVIVVLFKGHTTTSDAVAASDANSTNASTTKEDRIADAASTATSTPVGANAP